MYCVQCGVKLAESEQVCPLCGTKAYHPELPPQDGEPLYPPNLLPAQPGRSLLLPGLLTVLVVLAGLVAVLCDQQVSGGITWSGHVLGGLGVSYVALIGLWLLDYLRLYVSGGIAAEALRYLSVRAHFSQLSGGVFALSTLLYFVSLTAMMLGLTVLAMDARRRR